MIRAFIEVASAIFALLIITYLLMYIYVTGQYAINATNAPTNGPASGILNAVNKLPNYYTVIIIMALTVAIIYVIIKAFKPR